MIVALWSHLIVFSLGSSLPTTSAPKPSVTCLFMVDSQSLGIDQNAINEYTKYFHFAMTVGDKLALSADFTGYIDTFGYGDPEDHQNYVPYDLSNFDSLSYQTTTDNTDIDLDLKDVDAILLTALWVPPVKDQTCMMFISAAPSAMFGDTTIKNSYPNFQTVIGATIGANTIPGLDKTTVVTELSDADAQAVVDLLLKNIQ